MILHGIIVLSIALIVGLFFGLCCRDVNFGITGGLAGLVIGFLIGLPICINLPVDTECTTTTKNLIPLSQVIEKIDDDDKYVLCDTSEDGLIYTGYIKNKQGYPEPVIVNQIDTKKISSKKYQYIEKTYTITDVLWGYTNWEEDEYIIIAPRDSIYYTFVQ